MISKPKLTLERIKQVLSYDPATGLFRWKIDLSRTKAGSIAGRTQTWGYTQIQIDGVRCVAHKLAWFYMHGVWPEGQLDHRNVDPSDNRLANLRLATPSENKANGRRYSTNTSGYKGVKKGCRRWVAAIKVRGHTHHLGTFDTAADAHCAYAAAAQQYFGEFARAS